MRFRIFLPMIMITAIGQKSNSAPRCKQRGMFAPVISYSNFNKFICV